MNEHNTTVRHARACHLALCDVTKQQTQQKGTSTHHRGRGPRVESKRSRERNGPYKQAQQSKECTGALQIWPYAKWPTTLQFISEDMIAWPAIRPNKNKLYRCQHARMMFSLIPCTWQLDWTKMMEQSSLLTCECHENNICSLNWQPVINWKSESRESRWSMRRLCSTLHMLAMPQYSWQDARQCTSISLEQH